MNPIWFLIVGTAIAVACIVFLALDASPGRSTANDVPFNPLLWRSWLWIYESAMGGWCIWVFGRFYWIKGPHRTRRGSPIVDIPGVLQVFKRPDETLSVWLFDWHFIIQRKVRWWARGR